MTTEFLSLDTWIISDTHFGHDNIVKFCNRPKDHEELMVDNWLERVHIDDTVLNLGDLAYRGSRDQNKHWLRVLPGHKYFVWGNHDKQLESWYRSAGWTQVGQRLGEFLEEDVTRDGNPYINQVVNWGFYWQRHNTRILFSHYPDRWLTNTWDINVHGHIHNNPYSPKLGDTSGYRNVSVEVIDYAPVRLRDIL